MIKKLKIQDLKPLNRKELAAISGGGFASCVASCGDTVVICYGDYCNATDGLGCLSDREIKSCQGSSTLANTQDRGN